MQFYAGAGVKIQNYYTSLTHKLEQNEELREVLTLHQYNDIDIFTLLVSYHHFHYHWRRYFISTFIIHHRTLFLSELNTAVFLSHFYHILTVR